jgi:hypothetical protein
MQQDTRGDPSSLPGNVDKAVKMAKEQYVKHPVKGVLAPKPLYLERFEKMVQLTGGANPIKIRQALYKTSGNWSATYSFLVHGPSSTLTI